MRGFINDKDKSGIPESFTTQSIWNKLNGLLFLSIFRRKLWFLYYIAMNFCRYSWSWLVDNRIDLFNTIEVGLIVGVLDTWSTPRYIRQLTGWKSVADTRIFIDKCLIFFMIFTNTFYFVFPVTVFTTVLRIFGGFISSFKMFDSVANGNPLSSISSKSS